MANEVPPPGKVGAGACVDDALDMPDQAITVAALKAAMREFVAERNWEPFHSPKNLSMGAAVEAAELMEHFLWIDNEASRRVVQDAGEMEQIADEIADVACYLLAIGNTLGIDLSDAIFSKLKKNALKYPADQYRGKYRLDK